MLYLWLKRPKTEFVCSLFSISRYLHASGVNSFNWNQLVLYFHGAEVEYCLNYAFILRCFWNGGVGEGDIDHIVQRNTFDHTLAGHLVLMCHRPLMPPRGMRQGERGSHHGCGSHSSRAARGSVRALHTTSIQLALMLSIQNTGLNDLIWLSNLMFWCDICELRSNVNVLRYNS
jgi:hypothetical protein